MAEPILTKFWMKHSWVEGVQICSKERAWSPGGFIGVKGWKSLQILKHILLVNYKRHSFDISYNASLRHGKSSLFITPLMGQI